MSARDKPAVELGLDYAIRDEGDCALCGDHLYENGFVGISVRGRGRICEGCTDQHSPTVGGYDIASGLSRIDLALTHAKPQYRALHLASALRGLQTLGDLYRDLADQEEPA